MVKPLKMPSRISDTGILVGWSLEHEHKRHPIGIQFNAQSNERTNEFLDPILFNHNGHLLTIAPTGAGKGTGCIIPTLLRHKGPLVVIDPKGENYSVTARRRREMGDRVVLLDPFGITGEETVDRLDPLDAINLNLPQYIDEAATIADMLVPDVVISRDPFWEYRARQLIAALILHVLDSRPPALRNLAEVRYLLNQSKEDLEFTAKEMKKSKNSEIRQFASILSTAEDKVRASIVSTAQAQMETLRGNLVQNSITESTFSLDDVTKGAPMAIYIVIPPDKLESHGRLLRIWIGVLMLAIMRRHGVPKNRTLFILDEAAQLGRLNQLRQAITLLRGYGLQTWSFWQDLSQLKHLYPHDWETIINNCKVVQSFGYPNMRAARTGVDLSGFSSAHELLDLDTDEMLLMIAGDEAVIAQRPNYLSDPIFRGQYDANPFHTSDDDDELKPRRPQRWFHRGSEMQKRRECLDHLLRGLTDYGLDIDINPKSNSSGDDPSNRHDTEDDDPLADFEREVKKLKHTPETVPQNEDTD